MSQDTDEAAKNDLIAGYALGIGRRDRHGVIGYCHGGNIVGFVAMMCIFPDERKAFAYSVNTDSETAEYSRIEKLLIESMDIAEATRPQTAAPALDIAEWYGRYVLRPNRISDGFKTYEKVPGAFLYAHWLSVSLGLLGLTWLFVAGFIALLRYRASMIKRPEAPAFVTLLLLFLPAPFFLAQSFMALGDLTLASVLLAVVTLLLPVGMLLTLLRIKSLQSNSWPVVLHGLAAIFVLQWCAVLGNAGLLPLRLWT
jgi:hypothetical protein